MDFPISLTPEAIDHAKRWISRKQPGASLKVGVKGGGCSGLEYLVTLGEPGENDLVSDFDGLSVAVDPRAVKFVQGMTVQFSVNLLGGGFKFDNPNAARSCGCGTSFTPKKLGA